MVAVLIAMFTLSVPRLSTIRNADLVLVLHNHRIVESGTHEQLLVIKK